MTTGTKCCIHYKDGLPYCVECEKESDQRREELHAKLAGAEIALEQARAEIERLRMALEALYSWVKAEADHFGANAPDDDMIVMVSSAIKAAKGGV